MRGFFYSLRGIWFVVTATWAICDMAAGAIPFTLENLVLTLIGALLPTFFVMQFQVYRELGIRLLGLRKPVWPAPRITKE